MIGFKILEQINEKRMGLKSVFVTFLSLPKEGNIWFQKNDVFKSESKFKTSFLEQDPESFREREVKFY